MYHISQPVSAVMVIVFATRSLGVYEPEALSMWGAAGLEIFFIFKR